MKAQSHIYRFAACTLMLSCLVLVASVSYPAIKNMAVVVAADSNLPDLTMAEFTKLSKGAQKSWPDGRSFTLGFKGSNLPGNACRGAKAIWSFSGRRQNGHRQDQ